MKKNYKCDKCKYIELTQSKMGLGDLTCYHCPKCEHGTMYLMKEKKC